MLTFVLLTPLMGCKVAAYLDQYETENIAILLKEARENRRLNEQASQEHKDEIEANLSLEEERKRQAEQERIEKNVEKLQSEVEEINKEIRSLKEKRLEMQETKNQEKLKPELDRISKKIRSLIEKRRKIQENIKTQIYNSPKAVAERERK
ncbi:MAG: hypothetical protein OXG62_11410 [Nitrospinae bacterium]|nr:hypothetical protein [Nitrospinota bacterium]